MHSDGVFLGRGGVRGVWGVWGVGRGWGCVGGFQPFPIFIHVKTFTYLTFWAGGGEGVLSLPPSDSHSHPPRINALKEFASSDMCGFGDSGCDCVLSLYYN